MSASAKAPMQEEAPTPPAADFLLVNADTPPTRPQSGRCRLVARKLFELIEFHTFNAALGLGGGILAWILLPLSAILFPVGGTGILLFRFLVTVLARLSRLDVKLANQQCSCDLKLHVHLSERDSLPWMDCFALPTSTKIVRVVFYFAVPKFLVGGLSGAAAAWTVEQPLLAIISGGYNDVLGITTFEGNAILYVAILLGCWVIGVICTILVPKVSVPLTRWACCGAGTEKNEEASEAIHIQSAV